SLFMMIFSGISDADTKNLFSVFFLLRQGIYSI
ncbi:hypothetical protein SEEK9263_03911, partial [Salmonella enterica subsp. enterica serovar Kentucky str. ATCC 9263]